MVSEDSDGGAGGRVEQMDVTRRATRELTWGQQRQRVDLRGQSGEEARGTLTNENIL